jgi:cobalt-zinc-cadmium resistance protein CzcA
VNTQLEKSKLFPNLNIGYSNQSIQGVGANNVEYSRSTRFNAVQFGIGLPLFFGSQKALIDASKTLELISENKYKIGFQTMNTAYQIAIKQYQTHLQTVKYFEEIGLQNAFLITQTANKQFANGEINYLEWSVLINNAVGIQSDYIEAVRDLNQTILLIEYLSLN